MTKTAALASTCAALAAVDGVSALGYLEEGKFVAAFDEIEGCGKSEREAFLVDSPGNGDVVKKVAGCLAKAFTAQIGHFNAGKAAFDKEAAVTVGADTMLKTLITDVEGQFTTEKLKENAIMDKVVGAIPTEGAHYIAAKAHLEDKDKPAYLALQNALTTVANQDSFQKVYDEITKKGNIADKAKVCQAAAAAAKSDIGNIKCGNGEVHKDCDSCNAIKKHYEVSAAHDALAGEHGFDKFVAHPEIAKLLKAAILEPVKTVISALAAADNVPLHTRTINDKFDKKLSPEDLTKLQDEMKKDSTTVDDLGIQDPKKADKLVAVKTAVAALQKKE